MYLNTVWYILSVNHLQLSYLSTESIITVFCAKWLHWLLVPSTAERYYFLSDPCYGGDQLVPLYVKACLKKVVNAM